MSEILWITEADVVSILDMHSSIAALRTLLRLEANGEAKNMTKTVASFGHADTLHAIGAVAPGVHLVGTKTWAHTEGGASPLLVLWNAENGSISCIIEAFALGQLRTAAVSAVATDVLASADAAVMCIIGSGKQAIPQVAAVLAVRPIREIRAFSPTAAHRRDFARELRLRFNRTVVEAENVDDAVRDAQIVTLVTRATEPFLFAEQPARGAHINALGAIVPARMEFEPSVLYRCAVVTADSPEQTRTLSREFQMIYGDTEWERVVPLSSLVASDARRPADADLTLFKAMGMGISDVALGRHVLDAARKRGLGRPLPQPQRVPVQFFTTTPV